MKSKQAETAPAEAIVAAKGSSTTWLDFSTLRLRSQLTLVGNRRGAARTTKRTNSYGRNYTKATAGGPNIIKNSLLQFPSMLILS